MANFKILKAVETDARAIHRLIFLGSRRGKVLRRPLSEIRRQINSFFIARLDAETIGCVSLDIYNKKLAEVRSLVVRPPWEKREIASQLIRRCLGKARKNGIYEVLAITDRERLFKRFGFREELHGQKALFHRP